MIETTWVTETGWVVVKDALTIADWVPPRGDAASRRGRPDTAHESDRSLLRTMTCIDGEVEMEMECLPRFGYGAEAARWSGGELGEAVATARRRHRAAADQRHATSRSTTAPPAARVTLREDQTAFCALTWSDGDLGGPRSAPEALERIDSTEEFWREWLRDGRLPRPPLARSTCSARRSSSRASPTPRPGRSSPPPPPRCRRRRAGERNWDYRFSWIRDSTFSLWALHTLGFDHEARDFMRFIVDVCQDHPDLQIMYGIGHERELEREDARPPRGLRRRQAGADRQRRLRPAPERRLGLAARLRLRPRKGAPRPRHARPTGELIRYQVEAAIEAWPHPDQGIWESRGEPQHYVSSKLMIWVAVDRGARLARDRRLRRSSAAEWQAKADEFKAEILERGVRDGVFRQHYDTDALDASLLLIPLFRFLRPDDPRVRDTVNAIAADLTEHGLVCRYKVEETDDGLHGKEGTFLICSFWLVSALSEIGERAPGPRTLRTPARGGGLARPLRRGARRRIGPAPRQLPPGLHPPGADQRRLPRDRRREARGRRRHRGLHRDGRRPRGRARSSLVTKKFVDKRSTDKTISGGPYSAGGDGTAGTGDPARHY